MLTMGMRAMMPMPRSVQPTQGDGYMFVARDLVPVVEALAKDGTMPPRACALLGAQALECLLKRIVWKSDPARPELRDHELLPLWTSRTHRGAAIRRSRSVHDSSAPA